MSLARALSAFAGVLLVAFACADPESLVETRNADGGGAVGSGGAGAGGKGGAGASGGALGSGGTFASGGSSGTLGTGGSSATGGTGGSLGTGTGGSSGASGTGGSFGAGGTGGSGTGGGGTGGATDAAPDTCVATTCAAAGKDCGLFDAGCGVTLDCGVPCTLPETCGGGGVSNVCGCTPTACAGKCGTISNACGGQITCNCTAPDTCGGGGVNGECGCTGASCCVVGRNTDGDGMDDCTETYDNDPWTDRNVFNGMHVRQADQCSGAASCSNNNTLAKVVACMAAEPTREEKDQWAGWDFANQPNDLCTASYGFKPPWTVCDVRWQADWRGFIDLAAGQHCFAIQGSIDEQCGALFFDQETTPIQTGGAAKCFTVAAGVFPIHWHYTMDNGASDVYSMKVVYCFGGASACTPTAVLPASRLRPIYP